MIMKKQELLAFLNESTEENISLYEINKYNIKKWEQYCQDHKNSILINGNLGIFILTLLS
jgi:hypothetical protein